MQVQFNVLFANGISNSIKKSRTKALTAAERGHITGTSYDRT